MRIPSARPGFVATVCFVLFWAAGCQGHGVIAGQATLTSSGGTVDVQCIDRFQVKIVGAEPAAGFTVRMIVEGPAGQASLVFENENANDYRVAVQCETGEPGLHEFEIEDTTLTD